MLTKEDIRRAVDRNILVFDQDAKVGEFTERLVGLMENTARHNGDVLLHTLYVGNEPDIDILKEEWTEKVLANGVEVIVDDRLSLSGEFTKYFEELGVSLHYKDIHLVIAKGIVLGQDDGYNEDAVDVLLGSC